MHLIEWHNLRMCEAFEFLTIVSLYINKGDAFIIRCSGVQFCDHDDGVHVMCWLIWS